jgi:hypothetical protein
VPRGLGDVHEPPAVQQVDDPVVELPAQPGILVCPAPHSPVRRVAADVDEVQLAAVPQHPACLGECSLLRVVGQVVQHQ